MKFVVKYFENEIKMTNLVDIQPQVAHRNMQVEVLHYHLGLVEAEEGNHVVGVGNQVAELGNQVVALLDRRREPLEVDNQAVAFAGNQLGAIDNR